MEGLHRVDLFRDGDYGHHAGFEVLGQVGYRVGFFLEDEGREEGDDFGGFVVREDVVEDELCEDELICGMDLNPVSISYEMI